MSLCVHACVYGDLKLMWDIFSIDLLFYYLSSPGSLNQTQVINFACQLAPEICFTERENTSEQPCPPGLYVGAEDLNYDRFACAEIPLPFNLFS